MTVWTMTLMLFYMCNGAACEHPGKTVYRTFHGVTAERRCREEIEASVPFLVVNSALPVLKAEARCEMRSVEVLVR